MPDITTKETTVTTEEPVTTRRVLQSPVVQSAPDAETSQTVAYLVYFFFGALEILLLFRLALKITGANPGSGFVDFVYSLSQIFILPFQGIFRQSTAVGAETTAVLEPSSLVAIIVYAVVAWGIVQLVKILSGKQQPS